MLSSVMSYLPSWLQPSSPDPEPLAVHETPKWVTAHEAEAQVVWRWNDRTRGKPRPPADAALASPLQSFLEQRLHAFSPMPDVHCMRAPGPWQPSAPWVRHLVDKRIGLVIDLNAAGAEAAHRQPVFDDDSSHTLAPGKSARLQCRPVLGCNPEHSQQVRRQVTLSVELYGSPPDAAEQSLLQVVEEHGLYRGSCLSPVAAERLLDLMDEFRREHPERGIALVCPSGSDASAALAGCALLRERHRVKPISWTGCQDAVHEALTALHAAGMINSPVPDHLMTMLGYATRLAEQAPPRRTTGAHARP